MEANQKKKFICKFCNKKYPCGKSLGGHIRIHLNGGSSTAAAVNIAEGGGVGEDADVKVPGPAAAAAAAAAGGQSGYGLRENPKKTKWFTIDRSNNACLLAEKVCKECGKGFQSLKALCGHMACHSRNNSYFEDHSGNSEKLKELLVGDSQSDTETSTPSKRSRSERMRYKAIGANSSSLSFANGGGGSVSSASDIEQEQEEIAMCLMMLSRDSGFKGRCFSSVADSSDNNSLILEPKKNDVKCVYNGNGTTGVKKAKTREVKSIIENDDDSEDSGSGHFMNKPRRVESDVSTDGFSKIDELKKPKGEFNSKLDEDFDAELGKRLSRFRHVKAELGKDLIEKDGYDRADRSSVKYNSSKRSKNGSCDSEFRGSNARKQGKSFSLGGNRTSNVKSNACNDSLNESYENSIDTDYVPSPPNGGKMIKSTSGKSPIEHNFAGNSEKKSGSKKGKMHECPFCFKVFRSGQALGGHKRSHFVGGGGEDSTNVIKQEAPEIPVPALIDLNLPPAPMGEEANGFVPW